MSEEKQAMRCSPHRRKDRLLRQEKYEDTAAGMWTIIMHLK